MQIARDAETLGLLFKAMARHRCATVADLARHFDVAAGPPLLEALGVDESPSARWAEVAELSEALWHRPAWPGTAAVAPPTETPADGSRPVVAFAPPEAQAEPATALRTLREAVGLTAAQLAAKVGVPIGTVGDWERGAAFPEARQVGQLAQALGVAPEAVLAALPTPGDDDAGHVGRHRRLAQARLAHGDGRGHPHRQPWDVRERRGRPGARRPPAGRAHQCAQEHERVLGQAALSGRRGRGLTEISMPCCRRGPSG